MRTSFLLPFAGSGGERKKQCELMSTVGLIHQIQNVFEYTACCKYLNNALSLLKFFVIFIIEFTHFSDL